MTESRKWDAYMTAYQDALRATSKPWAPWYCIPADSKSYMRRAVADIVVDTFAQLPLEYPKVDDKMRTEMAKIRAELESQK
jgi:polyphosphate kinase 2 (PPK2 family)